MQWSLNWNDLSEEHRLRLKEAAESWACPCCGSPGQMALDMFNEVVDVIKERDRREVEATLTEGKHYT